MKIIALSLVLTITSVVFATGLEPSDFSLIEPTGSWFNPDFSGYSSFSVVTGGGRTLGSGLTVGKMSFSLHPDWVASVDVGYEKIYDFHGFSTGRVLGGMNLRWQPSEAFTLQFHFSGSFPDSLLTGF